MDQLQAALQKPKEKETPPATTSAAKGIREREHIRDHVINDVLSLFIGYFIEARIHIYVCTI